MTDRDVLISSLTDRLDVARTRPIALACMVACQSCITIQADIDVAPQNIAVQRAHDVWQDAGMPDVSGCVAESFVIPAQGPMFVERVCLWFAEEQGCVAPFSGLMLVVVAPGIPTVEHFNPIAHEALHLMTACVRGGQHGDPFDREHRDSAVWALEKEIKP